MRSEILSEFDDFPHVKEAFTWAFDVVEGKIPACKQQIQACQRQINDLFSDNLPFVFDPYKAEKPVKFIQLLPHTKGKWANKRQLLKLEPWQKFIIVVIFGWVDSEGFRRFREAYVNVPRKNGKSALAAGIGLYCLVADNEYGAEVYCGATNEKQALEVFKPARLMCVKTPQLVEHFGVEVNARNLALPESGAKFEPVIGKPGDGSSPHCAIIDEYHEHDDSDQLDTMVTGMGAREQPLVLIITTAGFDTSSPCYDKQVEVEKILKGVYAGQDTHRIFGIIFGVDSDDDWRDPKVLIKANPNYGVSVGAEYLLTQQQSAIRNSKNQNKFLIKHLNKWVNAKEAWISADKWTRCADTSLDEGDFLHLPVVLSLDLASKRDVASFMRIYYDDIDGERHYWLFGHHFLPEIRILDEDNHSYSGWVKDGYLTISGENEIQYSDVSDMVKAFYKAANVREMVHDPWKASHLVQDIQEDCPDLPIVEFRQNANMFTGPMDEFLAAMDSGRLHHDGCPVLTWMSGNVIAKPYKTDYFTPTKEKQHQKIDGIVASIMGVGRAMVEFEDENPFRDYSPRSL